MASLDPASTKTESPVLSNIKILDSRLSDLESVVNILEDRLARILTPTPCDAVSESEKSKEPFLLSENILLHSYRVSNVTSRISSLLKYLEI